MPRFLTPSQRDTRLRLGKPVEQFLGGTTNPNRIRYATIRKARDGRFVAAVYLCQDIGSADYADVYSFPSVGDLIDEPFAERLFAEVEGAVDWLIAEHQADPARFVGQGMVQDEYLDWKQAQT